MQALPPSNAMPAESGYNMQSAGIQSVSPQNATFYMQSAPADAAQNAGGASDDWSSALQTAQQSSTPPAPQPAAESRDVTQSRDSAPPTDQPATGQTPASPTDSTTHAAAPTASDASQSAGPHKHEDGSDNNGLGALAALVLGVASGQSQPAAPPSKTESKADSKTASSAAGKSEVSAPATGNAASSGTAKS
ncbi:hypothetical protein MXAZACID_16154, partial [Acidocella sp. MX-AZ02]